MTSFFRYAQIVIGPAGSGKTTYCSIVQDHMQMTGKSVSILNLDPAAENSRSDIDIRSLITLNDVMKETDLGPNGALVAALEYLLENPEWLEEQLNALADSEYLIVDCPGQIELFTHLQVMNDVIKMMQGIGFNLCAVYCLDVTFMSDPCKYISAALMALTAMAQLSIPHFNIMTKCDLISDKHTLEEYVNMDISAFANEVESSMYSNRYKKLSSVLAGVVSEYNIVNFLILDRGNEDTILEVVHHINMSLQYGENEEVNIKLLEEDMMMD